MPLCDITKPIVKSCLFSNKREQTEDKSKYFSRFVAKIEKGLAVAIRYIL